MKIDRRGNISIGKRLDIHILLPFLCVLAYPGGYFNLFALSWMFALFHEAAHILAGRALKIEIAGISLQPFGVCARLKNPVIKSPAKEIAAAIAGPALSLVLGCLFRAVQSLFDTELIRYCAAINFSLFCINLLPCLPLDGGRVLRATLTLGSNAITAWRITVSVSRIIAAVLLILAVVLLLTMQFNFSLLMIGAFLLGNLTFEQRSISIQALREILYYKEKLSREDLNKTCTFTAYADLPARRILHKLSYHKYYIVNVVNEHQRVIKTLTESQILKALLNKSIRITLGEI